MQFETLLRVATDERLFAIAEAFRRGMLVEEIRPLAHYDPWFLVKIRNIVTMEAQLEEAGISILSKEGVSLLYDAKRMGFTDRTIAELTGQNEKAIRAYRKSVGMVPTYKMVDTCAAEFEAQTPYFYSCYDQEDER